jgi:hypothetical protein
VKEFRQLQLISLVHRIAKTFCHCWIGKQENSMIRISPRAVVTGLLLLGIGSPGFAQSSYHSYRSVAHHARQHNAAIRQNGLNSFALVSPQGSYDATVNGGGSAGYNENLLIH